MDKLDKLRKDKEELQRNINKLLTQFISNNDVQDVDVCIIKETSILNKPIIISCEIEVKI